jgi:hypothetical protein
MSKLIFACAMLSSASFVDTVRIAIYFGPTAHGLAVKLRSALSFDAVMPALKRVDKR